MDLDVLLENCSWYDKWQFSADVYQNSLLQTKIIEIALNNINMTF